MLKNKILIIEDESIIALNLKEILMELGYEPCGIAPNRCKTIAILDKGIKPDLVLMDIYLKGPTTGIELAKELTGIFPNLPVVFLTANSELSTIKQASETFAYGYLIKPYQASHLQAAIEVAIKKAEKDNQDISNLKSVTNINKTLEYKLSLDKNVKLKNVKLRYGYLFDKERKILYLGKNMVKLTSKELDVVDILCEQPGEIISKEQIEYKVWEHGSGYAAFRSLLFRLRGKIHKDLISNQNNTGYKIEII
jgi:DNA-binding response OmpR family regulator